MTTPDGPKPDPHHNRPSWVPLVGGLAGLVVGGFVGGLVAWSDGPDKAIQLGLVGAFMGMVLAVVPLASRQRPNETTAPPDRRFLFDRRRPAEMQIPDGGLAVRPQPNRNAEPGATVAGGTIVKPVRRSGRWVGFRLKDGDDELVWVEGGLLTALPEPPPGSRM